MIPLTFLLSFQQSYGFHLLWNGPFPQTPGPTPAPRLVEVCLNGEWGTCLVQAWEQGGFWLVLLIFIVITVVYLFRSRIKGIGKSIEKHDEQKMDEIIYAQDAQDQATKDYLDHIQRAYQKFKYNSQPSFETATPTLDKAYLPIRISYAREREAKKVELALEGKMESPAVSLAEAIKKSSRLAIIGAAGSGKSTLLQWAGLACAKALTGKKDALSDEERGFLQSVEQKASLPVLVPLRAFDEYCRKKGCNRSAAGLRAFITDHYQQKLPGKIPNDFFARHKNCLWMLDGLDEVDSDDRQAVRQAVEDFLDLSENLKSIALIATRPSAAEIAGQLPGFSACYVQRLSPDERDRLVHDWYAAVLPFDLVKAKDMADDLCKRLAVSPQKVRELATTPLMVTIFAVIYYRLKDLPRLRAHLYEEAVKTLVMDTLHHEDDETPGIGMLAGMTWQTRRNRISRIAFEMFCQKLESIGEGDLVNLIADRFASKEEARSFIKTIAERGGLLECEDDRYGFYTHRTFQEYLAGRYLVEEYPKEDRPAFLKIHLDDDQWEEPIRLAVGYLAIGGEKNANDLIQLLAGLEGDDAARAKAITLAGLAMSDLQEEDLFQDTRQKVIPPALSLFTANPPRVPLKERLRLGLVLGAVGDPRLKPCPAPLRPEIQVIEPEMAPHPIPAGLYRLGTSEDDARQIIAQGGQIWGDEQPDHLVRLSEFQIGRYPVTNAEYECFVRAGYGDPAEPKPEWWSDDGWRWRTGAWMPDVSIYAEEQRKTILEWLERRSLEYRSTPFYWENPDWNGYSQPVVGVCWFEAEAYCNWLRTVTGRSYGLPSESQWETAARAVILQERKQDKVPENRLWPWGNEWDTGKCNTAEAKAGFQGTTSVGMYPHGASPRGAEDMAGNVWEWCRDVFDEKEHQRRKAAQPPETDPVRLISGLARGVRGGSWGYDRDFARCAARVRFDPGSCDNYIGFRVVLSPTRS